MRWQFGFFDWNGTLLNDLKIAYRSVVEIFERFRLKPPTLEEYRSGINSEFSKFYYERGIPSQVTPEELNRMRAESLKKHWRLVKLNRGALATLHHCHQLGIKIGVVSAEVPAILEERLLQFGLKYLFCHAEGGAWPKKDALRRLAENLGLQNSIQAFYADDTADGIRAAQEAGFTTIGFTNGYALPRHILKAKPNFAAHSFSDIRKIIESA